MKRVRPIAALLALTPAACAPADEDPPAAANGFTVGESDVDPATGIDRNVTCEPRTGPQPGPTATVIPDVDPETGIDRNVTYEPQVGPEPQEPPRKDAPESSSRR